MTTTATTTYTRRDLEAMAKLAAQSVSNGRCGVSIDNDGSFIDGYCHERVRLIDWELRLHNGRLSQSLISIVECKAGHIVGRSTAI